MKETSIINNDIPLVGKPKQTEGYVPYEKEEISEVAATTSQESGNSVTNQESHALGNVNISSGSVTHEPGISGSQSIGVLEALPLLKQRPHEYTKEMNRWLSDNQDDYEFYLLHGVLHDISLRNQMLGLPLEPEVFAREEYALIIGAMKHATKITDVLGGEVACPPSSEFLLTYVKSAAREEASDQDTIDGAMSLLAELHHSKYTEKHYCIRPYFAAWYVAQRAKKKARLIQMEKIPNVRSVIESIQWDLHATSEMDGFMESRKFDFETPPEKIEPLLKFKNLPICTPGNISNIQAPAKQGKSALLGAIIASTIKQPWMPLPTDSLGFEANLPVGQAVLHFDTEQSQFDHDRQIRRCYQRAHVKKAVPWLHSYRLTGLDPLVCWNKMQEAIYTAKQQHGEISLIFIDGIADFCRDPNDASESFGLVRKLHALSSDLDCGIITVLHQNPGAAGKTRGHLGSQIERKAETSLRVEKTSDIFQVWAENARSCYIPKSEAWMFQWCDEKQMHMSLPPSDERWETKKAGSKKPDKTAKYSGEVKRAFGTEQILNYSLLCREICRVTELAESTAKTRISEYAIFKLIEKVEGGGYRILIS